MRSKVLYRYGRYYGDYPCNNFMIHVDYQDVGFSWNEGEYIDFDKHQEFSKKLEDMLLDQISPIDVKTKTYSWKRTFKRIILKGEQITKLNLKAIKDAWEEIDFSKTSWSKKIKELKNSYTRKILKSQIKQNNVSIEVNFLYDGYIQKSGSFTISPQVAKWLGEQLIKASQGELEINGSKIKVKEDRNIVPIK